MKFIFLQSGDELTFEPSNAEIIQTWFDFIFANDANLSFISSGPLINTRYRIKTNISILNSKLKTANNYLQEQLPLAQSKFLFPYSTEYDQAWLNYLHKRWVEITQEFAVIVHGDDVDADFRNLWDSINHLIHDTEGFYAEKFINTKVQQLPEDLKINIKPEDCNYNQQGITISFDNLGRHQYDQWCVNSALDGETNNYKIISTSIDFVYRIQNGPAKIAVPPVEYVQWCNENGLEVLPPHLSLGDFPNHSREELKKIFYKNLILDGKIGFER